MEKAKSVGKRTHRRMRSLGGSRGRARRRGTATAQRRNRMCVSAGFVARMAAGKDVQDGACSGRLQP